MGWRQAARNTLEIRKVEEDVEGHITDLLSSHHNDHRGMLCWLFTLLIFFFNLHGSQSSQDRYTSFSSLVFVILRVEVIEEGEKISCLALDDSQLCVSVWLLLLLYLSVRIWGESQGNNDGFRRRRGKEIRYTHTTESTPHSSREARKRKITFLDPGLPLRYFLLGIWDGDWYEMCNVDLSWSLSPRDQSTPITWLHVAICFPLFSHLSIFVKPHETFKDL